MEPGKKSLRGGAISLLCFAFVACGAREQNPGEADAAIAWDASNTLADGAPSDATSNETPCTKPSVFINMETTAYQAGPDDATTNTSSLLSGPHTLTGIDLPYAAELMEEAEARLAGHALLVPNRPSGEPYNLIAVVTPEAFPFPEPARVVSPQGCPAQANRIAFVRADGLLTRDANRIASAAGLLAGLGPTSEEGSCLNPGAWDATVTACTFVEGAPVTEAGCHGSPQNEAAIMTATYLCPPSGSPRGARHEATAPATHPTVIAGASASH